MKWPHAHFRWELRLGMLFMCLAVLFSWFIVSSTGWVFRWDKGGQSPCSLTITSGAIRIMFLPTSIPIPIERDNSRWYIYSHPPGPTRWFIMWKPLYSPSSGVSLYILPLWIPSLFFLILSLMLVAKARSNRESDRGLIPTNDRERPSE